jgi:hypothetical protein
MKNFFIIFILLLTAAVKAQNWQPFASAPANYTYVVADTLLPNPNLMPLIEGVNSLSQPLLHPQYGLRVYDYQLQGNTQRWKVKPNNNLLYLQQTEFGDDPPPFVSEPGRFLLKEAEFSGDTITLSGSNAFLKFSIFVPPGIAHFAGLLDGNQVFLESSDVYFVNVGPTGDSLIDYTAVVYNQNMEEQISHPLHGRQIITLSKNRGLLQFPDMAFMTQDISEHRFVSCNRIEFQEPLVEDYLTFDVGDRFLFRIFEPQLFSPSYLTLNEIISKTEETDQFVYVEKIKRLYSTSSTFNTFVVPKNIHLRSYLITHDPIYGIPYPQTALAMDSIVTGPECGAGMEEFTYLKAPMEMQGRNCLTNPYGGQMLMILEGCDFTRMIVAGVGFLHSYCFMTLSGNPVGPGYVPVFDRKALVAYQKANGDSYHQIEANWNITENQTSEISVFPNPSSDQVTLKSVSGSFISEVVLLDMFGKVIRQEIHPAVETVHFSLEQIPAGIYYLRIGLASGRFLTQKIIKTIP